MFVEFDIDGDEKLKVAVLVDVDGTLAGLYQKGKRKLRPSAIIGLQIVV